MADGLAQIVDRLGNAPDTPPDGWSAHEWGYVKGIASAAILRLREDLVLPWALAVQPPRG